MNRRFEQHTRESYAAMRQGSELQSMFDSGEIQIFHDLALSYPEEMKLLLCKSSGSHYENLNVEHQALATEIRMAVFVSSAQMILKLGIATTALVGGTLFVSG